MNRSLTFMLVSALAVFSLAACDAPDRQETGQASVTRHITISDGRVGAIASNCQTAGVDAQGGIEIKGEPLDLDQDQRGRGADYHRQAMTLREDALRVGRQRIKTGSTAVREVVSGLASGNPDQIGNNIDQEARRIEEHVEKMCGQLARLRESQDTLAEAVPAFVEYATIDASIAEDCDRHASSEAAEAIGQRPLIDSHRIPNAYASSAGGRSTSSSPWSLS